MDKCVVQLNKSAFTLESSEDRVAGGTDAGLTTHSKFEERFSNRAISLLSTLASMKCRYVEICRCKKNTQILNATMTKYKMAVFLHESELIFLPLLRSDRKSVPLPAVSSTLSQRSFLRLLVADILMAA